MGTSYNISLLGNEVYYEQYKSNSEKPPYTLILIHGFLACTFSFRKLIPLLRSKYDVYALDLVGFGKSEKGGKFVFSYRNYGLLIMEFTKKMELKNVVLVGHSMGGQIALHAAQISPAHINRLVLIGCSGYLSKAKRRMVWLSYLPFIRLGVRWWINRHKVEDVLRTTVVNPKMIDQQMIKAYSDPIQEDRFCDTLIGLLRNREGDLTSEELKGIQLPALLVWGEQDQIVPLGIGVHLRQDLPNSTLVSFPDAGHQVVEEKPEQVFNAIEHWLHEDNHSF